MRSDESDDEVIEGYWTFHRLHHSADRSERLRSDEWLWAFNRVSCLVRDDGAASVPLLVGLADAAHDDEVGNVGAGFLEDLLHLRGRSVVDAIDDAARRNRRFARELGFVVWPDTLDDEQVRRLQRFNPTAANVQTP